jgi:cbb3-type cytochrome oxidase maturation protein
MTALLVLIPVALFLGALGLAAFLWSMKSGQYDDLDGAAARILYDEAFGDDGAGNVAGFADPQRNACEQQDDGSTGKP